MGSLVNIQFQFPKWEKKFKASLDEIRVFIAATMQTNRGLLFDNEGAYSGHQKWAPLKMRVGQILKLSGALSKSMGPKNARGKAPADGIVRFSGDMITIGTTLAYARLMNDGTTKMPGGVLRAEKGRALKIPLPPGKKASDYAQALKGNFGTRRSRDIHQMIEDHQKIVDRDGESKKAKAHHRKQIAGLKKQLKARPDSFTKKDLLNRIVTLQAQAKIAHIAKDTKKRDALNEKIERYKNAHRSMPDNERYIFRKSVRIPARPFDTWTQEDQDELETALVNKLSEVLSR